MTNLEKITTALSCHMIHDCRPDKCPYANDDTCASAVYLDTIELLKE